MNEKITAVMTSCGRQDILEKTLRSFLKCNTYPIEKIIIIEDGDGSVNNRLKKIFNTPNFLWLETGQRVGQIKSIDHAYSYVETDYIFHMEDDWLFYRGGFIEKSLKILQKEDKCVQVWIRLFRWLRHPLSKEEYNIDGVQYRILQYGYKAIDYGKPWIWNGFSFNPGLRRRSDYLRIGKYSDHVTFDFKEACSAEEKLSEMYKQMGYYAAILSDNNGSGYVRHVGVYRHVDEINTYFTQLTKRGVSLVKQFLPI